MCGCSLTAISIQPDAPSGVGSGLDPYIAAGKIQIQLVDPGLGSGPGSGVQAETASTSSPPQMQTAAPPPATTPTTTTLSASNPATPTSSSPKAARRALAAGSGAPAGVESAWAVAPLSGAPDGTLMLQLTAAGRNASLRVGLDLTPPSVWGRVLESRRMGPRVEPAAASEEALRKNEARLAVVLSISFSEPLEPGFDITLALQARDALITEWQLAPTAAGPSAAGPGPAGPTFYVLAVGIGLVTPTFVLPASAYRDVAGNPGANGLFFGSRGGTEAAPVGANTTVDAVAAAALLSGEDSSGMSTGAAAAAADTAQAVSAATAAAIATSSLLSAASGSFASVLLSRGSLLQSSYHIQLLAMSSYLSSGGVGDNYRSCAAYFRWSILAIKGNVGSFDSAFKNTETTVNATLEAQQAMGGGWPVAGGANTSASASATSASASATSSAGNGVMMPPPARPARLLAGLSFESGSGPESGSGSGSWEGGGVVSGLRGAGSLRRLQQAAPSLPPSSPRPNPAQAPASLVPPGSAATGANANASAAAAVLSDWLRSLGNGTADGGSDAAAANSSSPYYFQLPWSNASTVGNATATVGGGGLDAGGGFVGAGAPPPASPPSDTVTYTSNMQDLLYTLAVAVILVVAVAVLRLVAALLYTWLVSPDLHPVLMFPRIETMITGLILVALTFYACLALGGPQDDWIDSRAPAIVVLLCLVLPYFLLVWWLALGRLWLVRTEVRVAADLYVPGPHWDRCDLDKPAAAAAVADGAAVDGADGGGGAVDVDGAAAEGKGDMYMLGPHWRMAQPKGDVTDGDVIGGGVDGGGAAAGAAGGGAAADGEAWRVGQGRPRVGSRESGAKADGAAVPVDDAAAAAAAASDARPMTPARRLINFLRPSGIRPSSVSGPAAAAAATPVRESVRVGRNWSLQGLITRLPEAIKRPQLPPLAYAPPPPTAALADADAGAAGGAGRASGAAAKVARSSSARPGTASGGADATGLIATGAFTAGGAAAGSRPGSTAGSRPGTAAGGGGGDVDGAGRPRTPRGARPSVAAGNLETLTDDGAQSIHVAPSAKPRVGRPSGIKHVKFGGGDGAADGDAGSGGGGGGGGGGWLGFAKSVTFGRSAAAGSGGPGRPSGGAVGAAVAAAPGAGSGGGGGVAAGTGLFAGSGRRKKSSFMFAGRSLDEEEDEESVPEPGFGAGGGGRGIGGAGAGAVTAGAAVGGSWGQRGRGVGSSSGGATDVGGSWGQPGRGVGVGGGGAGGLTSGTDSLGGGAGGGGGGSSWATRNVKPRADGDVDDGDNLMTAGGAVRGGGGAAATSASGIGSRSTRGASVPVPPSHATLMSSGADGRGGGGGGAMGSGADGAASPRTRAKKMQSADSGYPAHQLFFSGANRYGGGGGGGNDSSRASSPRSRGGAAEVPVLTANPAFSTLMTAGADRRGGNRSSEDGTGPAPAAPAPRRLPPARPAAAAPRVSTLAAMHFNPYAVQRESMYVGPDAAAGQASLLRLAAAAEAVSAATRGTAAASLVNGGGGGGDAAVDLRDLAARKAAGPVAEGAEDDDPFADQPDAAAFNPWAAPAPAAARVPLARMPLPPLVIRPVVPPSAATSPSATTTGAAAGSVGSAANSPRAPSLLGGAVGAASGGGAESPRLPPAPSVAPLGLRPLPPLESRPPRIGGSVDPGRPRIRSRIIIAPPNSISTTAAGEAAGGEPESRTDRPGSAAAGPGPGPGPGPGAGAMAGPGVGPAVERRPRVGSRPANAGSVAPPLPVAVVPEDGSGEGLGVKAEAGGRLSEGSRPYSASGGGSRAGSRLGSRMGSGSGRGGSVTGAVPFGAAVKSRPPGSLGSTHAHAAPGTWLHITQHTTGPSPTAIAVIKDPTAAGQPTAKGGAADGADGDANRRREPPPPPDPLPGLPWYALQRYLSPPLPIQRPMLLLTEAAGGVGALRMSVFVPAGGAADDNLDAFGDGSAGRKAAAATGTADGSDVASGDVTSGDARSGSVSSRRSDGAAKGADGSGKRRTTEATTLVVADVEGDGEEKEVMEQEGMEEAEGSELELVPPPPPPPPPLRPLTEEELAAAAAALQLPGVLGDTAAEYDVYLDEQKSEYVSYEYGIGMRIPAALAAAAARWQERRRRETLASNQYAFPAEAAEAGGGAGGATAIDIYGSNASAGGADVDGAANAAAAADGSAPWARREAPVRPVKPGDADAAAVTGAPPPPSNELVYDSRRQIWIWRRLPPAEAILAEVTSAAAAADGLWLSGPAQMDAGGGRSSALVVRATAGRPISYQDPRDGSLMLKILLPSDAAMARFAFLFEDSVGEPAHDPRVVARAHGRPLVLLAFPINFTHKAACAVLLGVYGLELRSVAQLGMLVALQAGMLLFLLTVRPFVTWQLQGMEVICHTLELALFAAALAVVGEDPRGPQSDSAAGATTAMVVLFIATIIVVLLYELYRLAMLVRYIWRGAREWWAERKLARAQREYAAQRALQAQQEEEEEEEAMAEAAREKEWRIQEQEEEEEEEAWGKEQLQEQAQLDQTGLLDEAQAQAQAQAQSDDERDAAEASPAEVPEASWEGADGGAERVPLPTAEEAPGLLPAAALLPMSGDPSSGVRAGAEGSEPHGEEEEKEEEDAAPEAALAPAAEPELADEEAPESAANGVAGQEAEGVEGARPQQAAAGEDVESAEAGSQGGALEGEAEAAGVLAVAAAAAAGGVGGSGEEGEEQHHGMGFGPRELGEVKWPSLRERPALE
ncbi:hypothetical protein HYH03_017019 [Edaphochlamys debaryana]|uniref:Uncharacterized protein n=1 Tax=Edaphochlamys debaryana TaxID=47281 RepID=A0A836BPN8_9CHLO|nr:hypothetical protein HYH03_017019 [Edaphochlamys debaryana]|eukprot:KAG2484137.1 hypothetical protein HYH03_017019 [Edaphochlamys debaryana]